RAGTFDLLVKLANGTLSAACVPSHARIILRATFPIVIDRLTHAVHTARIGRSLLISTVSRTRDETQEQDCDENFQKGTPAGHTNLLRDFQGFCLPSGPDASQDNSSQVNYFRFKERVRVNFAIGSFPSFLGTVAVT